MTNPDLTLIAALLDRSGSMKDCKRATETSFDELIAKQRSEPGEAIVTLSMFDDEYDNVYANVPIADVGPLTLVPRNMTAMLDATGRFITEIGEHLASVPEKQRPGHVILLIMTDGLENASKEWTYDGVEEADHPAARTVQLDVHIPGSQHRRRGRRRPDRGAAGHGDDLQRRRRCRRGRRLFVSR